MGFLCSLSATRVGAILPVGPPTVVTVSLGSLAATVDPAVSFVTITCSATGRGLADYVSLTLTSAGPSNLTITTTHNMQSVSGSLRVNQAPTTTSPCGATWSACLTAPKMTVAFAPNTTYTRGLSSISCVARMPNDNIIGSVALTRQNLSSTVWDHGTVSGSHSPSVERSATGSASRGSRGQTLTRTLTWDASATASLRTDSATDSFAVSATATSTASRTKSPSPTRSPRFTRSKTASKSLPSESQSASVASLTASTSEPLTETQLLTATHSQIATATRSVSMSAGPTGSVSESRTEALTESALTPSPEMTMEHPAVLTPHAAVLAAVAAQDPTCGGCSNDMSRWVALRVKNARGFALGERSPSSQPLFGDVEVVRGVSACGLWAIGDPSSQEIAFRPDGASIDTTVTTTTSLPVASVTPSSTDTPQPPTSPSQPTALNASNTSDTAASSVALPVLSAPVLLTSTSSTVSSPSAANNAVGAASGPSRWVATNRALILLESDLAALYLPDSVGNLSLSHTFFGVALVGQDGSFQYSALALSPVAVFVMPDPSCFIGAVELRPALASVQLELRPPPHEETQWYAAAADTATGTFIVGVVTALFASRTATAQLSKIGTIPSYEYCLIDGVDVTDTQVTTSGGSTSGFISGLVPSTDTTGEATFMENPLGGSLGDGAAATYTNGAAWNHLLAVIVWMLGIVASRLMSVAYGHTPREAEGILRVPGIAFAVTALFTLPTARAATIAVVRGSPDQKFVGVLSLVGALAVIVSLYVALRKVPLESTLAPRRRMPATPSMRRFVEYVSPHEWVDLPPAERARAWRAVHAAGFLASLTATVRTGLRLDAITDAVGSARRRVSLHRLSFSRRSATHTETDASSSAAGPVTPMTPLTRLRNRGASVVSQVDSDEEEEEEEESDVENENVQGNNTRSADGHQNNHRKSGTTKRLVVRFTDRWSPCFIEYDAPHFRFFVVELFCAWLLGIVTGLRGSARQCQIGLILFVVFEAVYVALFFLRRPVLSRLGHAWIGLVLLLQMTSAILLLAARSASIASLAEYSNILSVAANCLCAIRCVFEAFAFAVLTFCVQGDAKGDGAKGQHGATRLGGGAAKGDGATSTTLLVDNEEDDDDAAGADLNQVLLVVGANNPMPHEGRGGAAGQPSGKDRDTGVSAVAAFTGNNGNDDDDDDTELSLLDPAAMDFETAGTRRASVLWDMTASVYGDGTSSVGDDDDRTSAWGVGGDGAAGERNGVDEALDDAAVAARRSDAAARAILTPPRYYAAAASPPMWLQDALLYSAQQQQQQRRHHRTL